MSLGKPTDRRTGAKPRQVKFTKVTGTKPYQELETKSGRSPTKFRKRSRGEGPPNVGHSGFGAKPSLVSSPTHMALRAARWIAGTAVAGGPPKSGLGVRI